MTKALYLEDSYLREFEAEVTKADGRYIVLNQTAFYPESGGQPTDTGVLIKDGEEFKVAFAKKIGSDISHEVDKEGLKVGDKVKGIIDWDRRYLLMRYHTAAHVISGIFNKDCGALITGNQLNIDKGRIDFNLENFDREKMDEYFKKANELIKKDLKILVSYMPMEEAKKDPTLFKLASKLPPAVRELRIVEIEGFDRQADGGTHVKSLAEVGQLEFTKAENKGANNRRVYFRLT
jgi:misacylated tRNA(Ala) deacylase